MLNTISGESSIDCGTEVLVVDHVLSIIRRLVFSCQFIEFFFCQVEVQHTQNLLKLILGDFASSELIKIEKEFFDPNPFHDNSCLKTFFDVKGIIYGVNSLLHESVVNNIQTFGLRIIEGLSGISQLTIINDPFWFWIFCNIFWENVLWSINVSAKFEIINLSNVSFVKVFTKEQLV